MGRTLERAVAILNGAVGDYLDRTRNGLSTPMCFAALGAPVPMRRQSFSHGSGRIVILVHGLMNDESVWTGNDGSRDFGSRLSEELGFTPLYVRYNSGLPIAQNGERLSRLIEETLSLWPRPVEEVLLIGYSMGGLIARSACHFASEQQSPWVKRLRRAVYVGTPHRGAPMERLGKLVTRVLRAVDDPYTRLAAELGDLRSAGIKDLGDPRHPYPLLSSVAHLLVAGTLSDDPLLAALFGDALVPLPSATDGACADPRKRAPAHVRIFSGLGHLELPTSALVSDAIAAHVRVSKGARQ
ncbi:MAG: alpha/beta hydrolase [Myxococcaceae bacterium]